MFNYIYIYVPIYENCIEYCVFLDFVPNLLSPDFSSGILYVWLHSPSSPHILKIILNELQSKQKLNSGCRLCTYFLNMFDC